MFSPVDPSQKRSDEHPSASAEQRTSHRAADPFAALAIAAAMLAALAASLGQGVRLPAQERAKAAAIDTSPAEAFIENTTGLPPRENLTKALAIFAAQFKAQREDRRLRAADLGAGAGNDSLYLLERGWDVVAVDVEPYAIETINRRYEDTQRKRKPQQQVDLGKLDARLVSMQQMDLQPGSFDLINASLSLPFVPSDEMEAVWQEIVDALRDGGVFTGHFFGPEHEWKENASMSFYSVQELFRRFLDRDSLEIRFLENSKERVRLGVGGTAFFHTVTVIVQKKNVGEPER